MHLPRVWAEIDLTAVAANFRACSALVGAHGGVLGVVKADAYGHGAVPVASTLERAGIAMLGVGDSHEAIQLRDCGVSAPILVLGAVVEQEIQDLVHHWITPTIHSPERISTFNRCARRLGVRMPVHLLIDTGMRRLGVTPDRAIEHVESILRSSHLALLGIGTHLASPAEDPEFTRGQIERFEEFVREARGRGIRLPKLHVASSAALERYAASHYDLVRVGGFLYGISAAPTNLVLRPVLSLHTQIVYLRDLPPNTRIGYGGTFTTRRATRIATLPVGYHDGYPHRLSNRAEVLVRGRRAPVVGRVTMDYITVDVTDVTDASVEDRVTLIGENGGGAITVEEVAGWAETICYEIPSLLGNRVLRRYNYVRAGAEQSSPPPRTRSGATEFVPTGRESFPA